MTFLDLLLADPNLSDDFKRAVVRITPHQLSAEAKQSLADDFTAEMRQEARERMDEAERGEQ